MAAQVYPFPRSSTIRAIEERPAPTFADRLRKVGGRLVIAGLVVIAVAAIITLVVKKKPAQLPAKGVR